MSAAASARPALDASLGVLSEEGVQLGETKLPAFSYDQTLRTILAAAEWTS